MPHTPDEAMEEVIRQAQANTRIRRLKTAHIPDLGANDFVREATCLILKTECERDEALAKLDDLNRLFDLHRVTVTLEANGRRHLSRQKGER